MKQQKFHYEYKSMNQADPSEWMLYSDGYAQKGYRFVGVFEIGGLERGGAGWRPDRIAVYERKLSLWERLFNA